MPTFQFYQNNQLINTLVGGDPRKLEAALRTHAPVNVTPKVIEEKSPYRYFPFKGFVYFDVTKNLAAIQKKILETNSSFVGTENANFVLTNEDVLNFKKTINTLNNTSFYHSSNFDNNEFVTVLKLIQWPPKYSFPALDMLRLLVLHPYAALHYAESFKLGRDDSVFEICVSFLVDPSLPQNNTLMIWRFLANLFKEDKIRTATVLTETEQILSLAQSSINHENTNIRFAVISTLLNLSVESANNKDLSHLKSFIAKLLIENLKSSDDADTLFRINLALGTCAYKDPTVQSCILPHLSKLTAPPDQANLSDSLKELQALLQN